MTTSNSGAVFFLGTRAHYQVLQQPEAHGYDVENGNASTETIYSNPSVPELWGKDVDDAGNYTNTDDQWKCCNQVEIAVTEDPDMVNTGHLKRRSKRTQSEATLFSTEDMQPAELNTMNDNDNSKKSRRLTLLSFLSSLARRKRRTEDQYLHHLDSALIRCTYRESCRCLDCQSRYFDCDESDYGSSEDEYVHYALSPAMDTGGDDDDEVFVDTVPEDNTSTDLLIDNGPKISASTETLDLESDELQWEVAAGTPVFLNYLLTHPITCSIQ